MVRLLTATLTTTVVALTVWFGGLTGVIYLGLYTLTLVCGLPLGWALFGRHQPVGWVSGAALGYGLSALAFWAPIWLGIAGLPAFIAAWLIVATVAWLVRRRVPAPLIILPSWTTRDTVTWLLVLHLVPAILALPFGHLGARDATGTKYYRAYFTADFVWHMALTEQMAHLDLPPVNPYFAPEPMHYYWTYFVVPAVLAGPEATVVPIESALKINAAGTSLLLFSLVFFAAWSACGRSGVAAAASAVALLAPSWEGIYEIVRIWRAGESFTGLLETNIDAITAWRFGGLRVDGLVRSMWYQPQHSMSLAFGLVAVIAATRLRTRTPATVLLAGMSLGLSVTFNPFLGAAFCLAYAGGALVQVANERFAPAALAAHALALLPVVLAIGWCVLNAMSEGAGEAITFGWIADARHAPVLTFLLSLGGIAIPALAGLWWWRGQPWATAIPVVVGLVVGVALMYFVSLSDRAWVGFRMGNYLQVLLPMLVARGFAGLRDSGLRWVAVGFAGLVLVAGLPTTLIDVYNAQDISNSRQGPGFRWTIPITPAQQAGFRWLREATSPDAIVQADPVPRGRENWSLIPSFAGRRMAAGQPISLLPGPTWGRRVSDVHALFTSTPAPEAHALARSLGIAYLWIDQDDGALGVQAMQMFEMRRDLFTTVFRHHAVRIFEVR